MENSPILEIAVAYPVPAFSQVFAHTKYRARKSEFIRTTIFAIACWRLSIAARPEWLTTKCVQPHIDGCVETRDRSFREASIVPEYEIM
jgi:hypothetical protein